MYYTSKTPIFNFIRINKSLRTINLGSGSGYSGTCPNAVVERNYNLGEEQCHLQKNRKFFRAIFSAIWGPLSLWWGPLRLMGESEPFCWRSDENWIFKSHFGPQKTPTVKMVSLKSRQPILHFQNFSKSFWIKFTHPSSKFYYYEENVL